MPGSTDSRRLSDVDALLWRIERDPLLRSTVVMVSLLDKAPDRARMMDRVERSTHMIPRLRQRVVQSTMTASPPRWATDPYFDLSYHFRIVNAPGAGTFRDVLDFATPIGMAGFDPTRPLWETTLIEGLADGRAALVQKVHHALTDGIGGMEMVLSTLDLEPEPAEEISLDDLPATALPATRGNLRRMRDQLARAARSPRDAAARTNEMVASLKRTMAAAGEPLSPLMKGRSMSVRYDTITVPRRDLKAASKAVGATINEAYVSALMGGLRNYHAKHGVAVDALRLTMPVSTRGTDAADPEGNNQFAPVRFPVPMTIEDPVERMLAVRRLVAEQLAEPAMSLSDATANVLNRMPTAVTAKLFGDMLKGADFTASNVPGPPVYLYFAGAKIEAQYPFGPLAGGAVTSVLLSGPDDIGIGINSDPAAIPDPDVLVECLNGGFDEVLALAK
jgi:WS/DGAT/MGAT family acyltransferase